MKPVIYILGGLGIAALAGGALLEMAIARNGAGVLDTVDRVAGGTRGAMMVKRASTGPHSQQKALVWALETLPGTPLPVIVFVHGGSWRDGDPDDYGFIGRAFVPEGFVVVLVGYRLGKHGAYPAMLEDTAAAIRWTRENIANHGGDPARIVLAGHSAGAYNAVTTALDTRWLERAEVPARSIVGVIGIAGPYDFLPLDSESTIAAFGHVDDLAATQPIAHISEDAPPMLLIHGGADTTVRPRNSRILARKLETAGAHAIVVERPDMKHSDPLIALAAPWRSRGPVFELVASFAQAVSQPGETSVPVQPQTR